MIPGHRLVRALREAEAADAAARRARRHLLTELCFWAIIVGYLVGLAALEVLS